MASPQSEYSSDPSPPADPHHLPCRPPRHSNRLPVAHPYARLYAKKDEVKRRKIWNHALEKSLFTPFEISTIGAPQRRTIYIASLEAHIDKLHDQLHELGYWPVPMDELKPYFGLNSKTAKSIVSGLQHDASVTRLKILELQRANKNLNDMLQLQTPISACSMVAPQLLPYDSVRPTAYCTTVQVETSKV